MLMALCMAFSGCGNSKNVKDAKESQESLDEDDKSDDKKTDKKDKKDKDKKDKDKKDKDRTDKDKTDKSENKDDKSKDKNNQLSVAETVYPDDSITLSFTAESQYHPEDYADIAQKGNMSEADIDHLMEGISDMLMHYEDGQDGTGGYGISQEFYTDEVDGTIITHSIVWTGNELMDAVMNSVGYKDYEVNYYYPYGLWADSYRGDAVPVYVSLYIDGNGYEYYFSEGQLAKRSGPEGESNNPKTNDFINSIYKIGCYYGNTLEGERGRYNIMISSLEQIEKWDDCFVLTGSVSGREEEYSFIIDKDSVFDDSADYDGFEGRRGNESFYDWYLRTYDAIMADEDKTDFAVLMGIFDVRTTKGHVDSACGTYWWD